jgi:hypothetical protein
LGAFTDLNTRVRHNTPGAHMHMIQAARRGWAPASRPKSDAPARPSLGGDMALSGEPLQTPPNLATVTVKPSSDRRPTFAGMVENFGQQACFIIAEHLQSRSGFTPVPPAQL